MDRAFSELPDIGHALVSLLTWWKNTGFMIIPALTYFLASHRLMLSKGNDF